MAVKNKPQTKKSFSLDWLVGGVLTKLGDTFDRFTGRGWNPSSSLATSKLTEKLKFLLDSEVRELGKEGRFVPHSIKLKIQWDKFSTDSEEELDKLKYELHAAAIDHINDRLYHTYAPMEIEIKTDYFTEGVKMLASFGKFSDKEDDEVAINVTVPNLRIEDLLTDNKIKVNLSEQQIKPAEDCFTARFSSNTKAREIELNFTAKKRISVGRSKENDLSINDNSVSKIHAALVLNSEKQLMVADTGSTNGTFINGKRISYGKAFSFEDDAIVKFGTVEVVFERLQTFVEEELIENEMTNEPEIMPTQAAVDLTREELMPEPEQAPAKIGKADPAISKPVTDLNDKKLEIEPTKASVDIIDEQEQPNDDVDLDFQSEDLEEVPDLPDSEKSKEVNLNETQDWEV